jgi:hypothetical protein
MSDTKSTANETAAGERRLNMRRGNENGYIDLETMEFVAASLPEEKQPVNPEPSCMCGMFPNPHSHNLIDPVTEKSNQPTEKLRECPPLLPCPFCGTEPVTLADGRVFCQLARCSAFYTRFTTPEQWNTRAVPTPASDERAAALEDAAQMFDELFNCYTATKCAAQGREEFARLRAIAETYQEAARRIRSRIATTPASAEKER